jgi:hypothetical protein
MMGGMGTLKKAALLALAGAPLNAGAMMLFQNVFRLPLFMDTMFTVSCTLLGGPRCGIAAAVLSHLFINYLLAIPSAISPSRRLRRCL